jgi:hypothetical protein
MYRPRLILVKFVRFPRLDGKTPVKFTALRFQSFRVDKFPKASGTGPKKLEYERTCVWRFVSCEILVGKGPSL